MRVISLCIVLTCLLTVTGIDGHAQSNGSEGTSWQAPKIEASTSIRRGKDGAVVAWPEFIKELSEAHAVFLGETHVDEATHRVELSIYERLLKQRDGNVVLSMEMFERDAQSALDSYLSGAIDEAHFLKTSRPWSNYLTAYRPMIELAKSAKKPVVAANFPRPMRRVVGRGGLEALRNLGPQKQHLVPKEIKPNTKEYWRRVDNAVRGHIAMMRPQAGDDQRLLSTQTLWDNSMGESAAMALDANPGFSVLHVNGGFHTAYWSGTARQFKLRKPDATMLTVDIRTSANPSTAKLTGAPTADYIVYAESRARDYNDGKWAVTTAKEMEYLLHMPKNLKPAQRVPLLVWFTDDGLSAQDGMNLWKKRLGKEAAIVVIESPYPAVQFDMGPGGRWFWPETFSEDIGRLNTTVERAWAYLSRYFPIDPSRLVVAGEGTGATVAATSAIGSDRMDAEVVAFSPRRYVKIKDFPLPLPELRGDDPAPKKHLRMILPEADKKWWQTELKAYEGIGIKSEILDIIANPWVAATNDENTLRAALGLNPIILPSDLPRQHLVVPANNPRAHYWARVRASATQKSLIAVLTPELAKTEKNSKLISTDVTAAEFMKPFALPRCPGPFGGTTVIVISRDIDETEKNAWIKLLESKPLNKISRFHRLRLAYPDGEHGLHSVLTELKEKNRKNVLIIPAEFCASATVMQALSRSVASLDDQMTIHWQPGLGSK
ncbi:MAG: putative iron-regulated protein [Planctomycetota bacterium]|jgi:uncharacterized iron-regulated protein